jgi:hypothetical protein
MATYMNAAERNNDSGEERGAELEPRLDNRPVQDAEGRRIAGAVAKLTEEEGTTLSGRKRLLSRIGGTFTRNVARGAKATAFGTAAGGRRIVDQVLRMAPHIPVRDQHTLREQFPGKSPEELAQALIDSAARASAGVGAAVGGWAMLPVLPAFPVEVAAETVALVGIEIKLVAELHEVYGARPAGSTAARTLSYVSSWANRRGVVLAPGGIVLNAGSPLYRLLRRRLTTRAARGAASLGPLMSGAILGAALNQRETRRLGDQVRADLRRRDPRRDRW